MFTDFLKQILVFRAILGWQQNWVKMQIFPMYSLPPPMLSLSYYQPHSQKMVHVLQLMIVQWHIIVTQSP